MLFTFLHSSQERNPYPTIYLRGLDPDRQYSLHKLGDAKGEAAPTSASGRYWMQYGVTPLLNGDFKAAAFILTASH